MSAPADNTITVMINGVLHTVDLAKIESLHAAIAAGPGDTSGEKLALAMTGNPLATAGEALQPDPDSRGD